MEVHTIIYPTLFDILHRYLYNAKGRLLDWVDSMQMMQTYRLAQTVQINVKSTEK